MRSSPARAIALVSGTRPLLFLVTVATVALCVALTLAAPVARAQEAEAAPAEQVAPSAEAAPVESVPVVAPAPTEEAPPPEVAADTEVTAADLGAKESRVLPGNPFYAFKRFGWGVQKAFTFGSVKKAALDLQHANQELADAQKRAAATGANEAVVRALERAQGRLQSISAQVGALQDAKATNAQGVEALMEHAAASVLQQQKAMERIAHGAPADLQERIAEHRDGVLAEVGTFMGNVDAPDVMRQRFERAMEQQRGSAFKHFNSLEVLQRIEATVPEQAKDAIRAAQEHAEERIAAAVTEQPERVAKFEQYVQHLPGDQVRQFETLGDVRAKLQQEFVERIDKMKTRAVEKFNTEFAQRGVEGRARMLEAFRGGDVEAVGLAEQFKNFVPPEARVEIEKHENESIEKFKQQFVGQKTATGEDADTVADEAQRLMEKVRTNPEPTDFIILQKLKEKLTPEQQAFVRGLERDGAQRFEEQFRARGAEFLERFADPNAPQSLEVLEGLRGSVPGIQGIDRAIEVHRRKFQEHLQDLEDPATLGHINDAIEGDAGLKAEFEKGDPSFFLKLGEQRERIEREQREKFETQIRERLQREAGEGALENVQQLTPEEKKKFLEQGGFPSGFEPPGFPGGFPRPGMLQGGPEFPGMGVPFEGGGFMPPGGPQGMPFGGRVERRASGVGRPDDARRGSDAGATDDTSGAPRLPRESGRTIEQWGASSDQIPSGTDLRPEDIQKIDALRRGGEAEQRVRDDVRSRQQEAEGQRARERQDADRRQESHAVQQDTEAKVREQPFDGTQGRRGDARRDIPPMPPALQQQMENRMEQRTDRMMGGQAIDGLQGGREDRRVLPPVPKFDGGGMPDGGGGSFGPMMPGGFGPGAGGSSGFGAPPPPPSFGGEPLGILAPFAALIALLP